MGLYQNGLVEFTYHGSQDRCLGNQLRGKVVMVPEIQYEGGQISIEEGWATDVRHIKETQDDE